MYCIYILLCPLLSWHVVDLEVISVVSETVLLKNLL